MPKQLGAVFGQKPTGFVIGAPRILLRTEGAALAVGALIAFGQLGHSWWLLALLIMLPDAGTLGYIVSPYVGAVCYNSLHTSFPPVLLACWGALVGSSLMMSLGAIWIAHIGIERMIGLGLRYPNGFGDTHLGRFVRKKSKRS